MYPWLRSFLFLFPAESVHYFSMNVLRALCTIGVCKDYLTRRFTPVKTSLETRLFGLTFKNPVGLGAGFDKNARYLSELETLGFGFVEIGTVTPEPQDGNEKPRLFRLPKDKALINRMGFNNDGAKAIAARLRAWHMKKKKGRLIIGGNIGKNKQTLNEEAYKDFESCYRQLADYVDYFVINVSSPNTPGLRALQEKDALRKILTHLQSINNRRAVPVPLLLKIAPDLEETQVLDVLELCSEIQLDGLIVSNTTISRDSLISSPNEIKNIGAGGLSGLPIFSRSTQLLQFISENNKANIPVIASGGIFTAQHAHEKFKAGAQLLQVWTGFIYEGPGIVKKICMQL
jgi:dihydroorotate dehydrogenase